MEPSKSMQPAVSSSFAGTERGPPEDWTPRRARKPDLFAPDLVWPSSKAGVRDAYPPTFNGPIPLCSWSRSAPF